MSDKVSRLVRALEHVSANNRSGAQLSDIASSIGGPLSSTHDLLKSMVATGLLQVDEKKRYRTGPTMARLAIASLERADVLANARPQLQQLVHSLGHDVYLAMRVGDTVTYVERFSSTRRAGLDIRLGDPIPLHSSAVGKLFAAYSPDLESGVMTGELTPHTPQTIIAKPRLAEEFATIRERGLSISNEETITGIIGFAAPIWDADGQLLAAVHVSVFKDHFSNADMSTIMAAARDCAMGIEKSINDVKQRFLELM